MRSSSQNLRQQVLRAVGDGKSHAQIIERFQVSRATIKRYVKQQRETGNVLPRPIAGRTARIRTTLQMGVQELLQAHPDASQNDYCQWWEAEHGMPVSRASMSRAIHALGWTRTKRRSSNQKVPYP